MKNEQLFYPCMALPRDPVFNKQITEYVQAQLNQILERRG